MASIVHDYGLQTLGSWDSLDVRALLLKSSATPTKDMQYVSALVSGSAELSVTGYSRQAVGSEAETTDTTNHLHKLTFGTVTFSGLSGTDQTAGWCSLYVHNASDASALVLVTFDIPNTALGTTNTSFTLSPPTNGIRFAQKGVL